MARALHREDVIDDVGPLESEFVSERTDEISDDVRSPTRRSRAVLPAAFGVLLMIAIGEAAYILRTIASRRDAQTSAIVAIPRESPSGTAPAPPRAAPQETPATREEPASPAPKGSTGSLSAPAAPASPPQPSTPGFLEISAPIELDIISGGQRIGSTASRVSLPAGTHTLVLVSDALRYKTTLRIQIDPNRTALLSVTMPQTTIQLDAQPWAEVWIDGQSVGKTPLDNLSVTIGTHEILFRHPELGERRVSTVVRAGLPARVAVDLRQ